jgi:hypothetical protein
MKPLCCKKSVGLPLNPKATASQQQKTKTNKTKQQKITEITDNSIQINK